MSQTGYLRDVEGKLERHAYEDGLVDLLSGFLYFLLCFAQMAGWSRFPFAVVWLAFPVVLFGPGLHVLRQYITYPRTGYVKYKRPKKLPTDVKRTLGVVLVIMAIGPIFMGVAAYNLLTKGEFGLSVVFWMHLGFSLCAFISPVGLLYIAVRSRVSRYFVVGGTLLLVDVLIMLLVPGMERYTYMAASSALLLLVSGGITLLAFLRKHPVLPQEVEI